MESFSYMFFFFNDTATTEIYTLSLHDALPIFSSSVRARSSTFLAYSVIARRSDASPQPAMYGIDSPDVSKPARSEEHTSELQSRQYLVCRLLLEKKKKKYST